MCSLDHFLYQKEKKEKRPCITEFMTHHLTSFFLIVSFAWVGWDISWFFQQYMLSVITWNNYCCFQFIPNT